MKHTIDLTQSNFDRIDFQEATILDFPYQRILPSNLDFSVWGARLLLDPHWTHNKSFMPVHDNKDLYVSGMGVVKISNLVGGSIKVYVYDSIKDELNHTVVAKNHDGSELVVQRTWGDNDLLSKNYGEYLYDWECVMNWPYGFCVLRLYSDKGFVTYEYDTDNVIPEDEYLVNPLQYNYNESRVRRDTREHG